MVCAIAAYRRRARVMARQMEGTGTVLVDHSQIFAYVRGRLGIWTRSQCLLRFAAGSSPPATEARRNCRVRGPSSPSARVMAPALVDHDRATSGLDLAYE